MVDGRDHHVQSGTPFTVANGSVRNGFGTRADRPDIGHPIAPLSSRAIIFPQCATGYKNPDIGCCVRPSEVHWVEDRDFPALPPSVAIRCEPRVPTTSI